MTNDGPLRYFPEILEFRQALSDETDRGCALMAAAYLSDQLERLLRYFFPKNENSVDALFEPMGPLGSFSARIDVALACGLLPRVAHRDLHLIRKIRNDFGHTATPITFTSDATAARCRELQLTFHQKDAEARSRFTSAALGVCAVIHAGLHLHKPTAIPPDPNWGDAEKREARDSADKLAEWILASLEQKTKDKGADG